MSAGAQGVDCYICGHPVDQAEVLKLWVESEGVVPVLGPFRLCTKCSKAAIDGKLSNPFVKWYTTQPAP